jgi:Cu(I)/Ag(I) efflux system membrane fusion protein
MKNTNSILIALAFLLMGLGAGYLIFNRGPAPAAAETHDHSAPAGADATIYTCSMHPQVRQEEPGLCPICEMELIPVDETASEDPLVLEMTPAAVKLAQVETTVVGATARAEKTIELQGKIKADERQVASQVAHIPGRIEQLFVTFTGETVRRGQPLATIYSPELVTAQRELLEALKFRDVNEQLVEAARKKLQYWRIPDTVIDEVMESGQVRETITVAAEAGGVVTERKVAVGDYVREGEVLFEIVDLSRLWVLFDAYEEDLANIEVGDRVTFTTPALPEKIFTTRISFIDPVIDPVTRVASLRGELTNRSGQLKPEMFVRGTVLAEVSAPQGLVIPRSAVLWTGKRSVVYLKVPDAAVPSYRYREVVLGKALGDQYFVESGLQSGDEVVTNGAFTIDAAAQLNNQQSMMNRLVRVSGQDVPAAPDFRAAAPAAFQQQLQVLTQRYLAVKDALVETDPTAAAGAARAFLEALERIDMSLLEGAAHAYWMQQQHALEAHAGRLSQAEKVEEQRAQFEFLSNAIIETVRAFGTEGAPLYIQHCPMAFNDKGADWLSLESEIRNPYFGEQMLKCGLVVDSLGME